MRAVQFTVVAALLFLSATRSAAQENYEIQVYGSETMAPGVTMFELHSNFTFDGSRFRANGLLPTNHVFHETVEITRGLNDWSELGVYFFNSASSDQGFRYVGSHLRPRVRAPERWNWPVGASLSAEFGFQKREFSEDTWSLELRPIIDKQMGAWYVSLNPTVERSLKSDLPSDGFVFSPNVALTYDLTPKVNVGAEYYGALGPLHQFAPRSEQEHVVYAAVNLDVAPEWEVNFGYGFGLTGAGDKRLFKLILGRRVGPLPAPEKKSGQ
ncbi:MAG: hypothetical protein JWM95_2880 [Gemmatimonadetes bacterium]|nr:hypothetical protein [Gemmatimonadota bacterium]